MFGLKRGDKIIFLIVIIMGIIFGGIFYLIPREGTMVL